MDSSVYEHSELQHLAIAGAGLSGARTAFSLRKLGFSGTLTIINAEQHAPYDRPPLSKELFTRTTPALLSSEQGVDIAALADQVLDSTQLAAISSADSPAAEGPVLLELSTPQAGPQKLRVDGVVLATGSRALRPPHWEAVRTLRTIDDAAALRSALLPGQHLVIVGAGWIGAEVATAARTAGVRVTVVETAKLPFSRVLPEVITQHMLPWFAEAGVDLRLGETVTQVVASSSGKVVQLGSGEQLAADEVLVAAGVHGTADPFWPGPSTPNGLIPVDSELRPTNPGHLPAQRIRVVGDLAGRVHPSYDAVPTGHWDYALHDGEMAAASLLRAWPISEQTPPALPVTRPPYIFSEVLGRHLALLGIPSRGDRLQFVGDPSSGEPWVAQWHAPSTDKLRAVFTVNSPRALSAARRTMRDQ